MPDWSEEVVIELEALQATYGDELIVDDHQSTVSMLLQPSNAQQQAYVQCLLQLTLYSGYPEAAAAGVALQDAKGLGSSRLAQLQGLLQQEASGMLGEMMLGQLFDCGRDWLNEHNWPEGPCIFCLEELCSDSSSSSSQAYMRLPCFHAFHQKCFADWWCWQQQAFSEQQQQLEQRTGATAAAALAQEQLPSREGLHFQLTCPSCRAGFSLQQDLQHMLPQLLGQQQQQQQQQQQAPSCMSGTFASGGSSSNGVTGSKLTVAELAPFTDIQRRHAALFAEQQQRQGIIVDASYSITDLPAAAAATAGSSSALSSSALSSSGNSRGSGSRGGRSNSSSRGGSSRGRCAAHQLGPAAGERLPHSSNSSSGSRGRHSSRGRGVIGSSGAPRAGRDSGRGGRGDQNTGMHAVQGSGNSKYDSRPPSVSNMARGRGSNSSGRNARGRGPQQHAGVDVASS